MSVLVERSSERIGALCAAGAAAVALYAGSSALAAVVYSGIVNINIPTETGGLYLNVETGQHNGPSTPAPSSWDLNLNGSAANSINFWSGSGGATYMRAVGVSTGFNVGNLPSTAAVSSSGSFATNMSANFGSVTGHWNYNSVNIFGFRFLSDSGGYKYGWMRVFVGANAQQRYIMDWAIETSGGSIMSGIVPGPTGLMALAMGAPLFGSRRRK